MIRRMGTLFALWLGLLLAVAWTAEASPYVKKCQTRYFVQPKDHFSFKPNPPTFKHRVLFNLDHYGPNGPIFFYLGNEADVELYVDHSGLIWENAAAFKAAVVFAEHRYYGRSRLFPDDSCDMSLLTTEQALADYAIVVDTFKRELNASAVIGFGGSYGGMLATVFKFQYPHMVDGVIAASAPVLAYQGMEPPYDSNGFAQVVTRDAGPKCASIVRKGLELMFNYTYSKSGREALSRTFKLCKSLESESDAEALLAWTSSYWDYLAMGNFPYPSSYVQPDGAMLPPYPVKAACDLVVAANDPLLGLMLGANLFYNATKTKKCLFNEEKKNAPFPLANPVLLSPRRRRITLTADVATASRPCEGTWDWQWCTEHSMPFTSGTDKDMFYPPTGPFDPVATAKECKAQWNVEPNPLWARITYGGLQGLKRGLKNVVFSNGLLDPWSAGGVLDTTGFDPSVVRVLIPHGAHHLDLMFSHKDDPLDVILARRFELIHITRWIKEAKQRLGLDETNDSSRFREGLSAGPLIEMM